MIWLLAIMIAGGAPDLGPVEYHIAVASERDCRDAVKAMAGGPIRARCLLAVDLGRHHVKLEKR